MVFILLLSSWLVCPNLEVNCITKMALEFSKIEKKTYLLEIRTNERLLTASNHADEWLLF